MVPGEALAGGSSDPNRDDELPNHDPSVLANVVGDLASSHRSKWAVVGNNARARVI
jgi:hypothetical protein